MSKCDLDKISLKSNYEGSQQIVHAVNLRDGEFFVIFLFIYVLDFQILLKIREGKKPKPIHFIYREIKHYLL